MNLLDLQKAVLEDSDDVYYTADNKSRRLTKKRSFQSRTPLPC